MLNITILDEKIRYFICIKGKKVLALLKWSRSLFLALQDFFCNYYWKFRMIPGSLFSVFFDAKRNWEAKCQQSKIKWK